MAGRGLRETYLVLIVFNRGASHNDDPLLPDALAKLARWCSQMTCGADGTVRFYEQSGFGEGVVLSPSQHRSGPRQQRRRCCLHAHARSEMGEDQGGGEAGESGEADRSTRARGP